MSVCRNQQRFAMSPVHSCHFQPWNPSATSTLAPAGFPDIQPHLISQRAISNMLQYSRGGSASPRTDADYYSKCKLLFSVFHILAVIHSRHFTTSPPSLVVWLWSELFCTPIAMLAYIPGALFLFIVSVSADSKHTCYFRRNDQISIGDQSYFQCNNTDKSNGGAQLCCRDGDQCGQDSICHTSEAGDANSTWYVGGCTDGTYDDPVCRTDCSE